MYKKLSADPNALIFGIISLVIVFLGCCCGLFVLVSFALSIVGLVLANKSLREYNNAPDEYSFSSKNNVFVAKVLNIIGLVLSSLILVFYILYFAFFGTLLSTAAMKDILTKGKIEEIKQMQDSIREVTIDSINEENELYIDTLNVESEKE
jgi:hypothetical protein